MTRTLLTLAALLSLVVFEAAAQSPGPPAAVPKPKPPPDDFHKEEQQDGSKLPEEMRVRLEIERADAEHRKILEDADKLNDLSEEVHKDYQQNGRLSTEDFRKVGTIEKLAKRILTHAGGDQVEEKNGHNGQLSLKEVLTQLGTAAASIKKEMKAETRFVVSASVISHSNTVITLAQLIRHLIKTD